jgi:hypothetical protein
LTDINTLNLESSDFKYHADGLPFWISLWHWLVTFIVTSLKLPFWHIQIISKWLSHSDLMNVVKIKSQDSHFNCELIVSVKLCRAAKSLSDVDSHFFPKQYNSSLCSLVNVCAAAQQYTGT